MSFVFYSWLAKSSGVVFFFKQKTAYEMDGCLEFRRVLFRSRDLHLAGRQPLQGLRQIARPYPPSRAVAELDRVALVVTFDPHACTSIGRTHGRTLGALPATRRRTNHARYIVIASHDSQTSRPR